VGIIEKDIDKMRLGQKVKVNVDAYPQLDFYGEIHTIPSLVEAKARTLPCKVKIDNTESLLKPGMFARCEIYVFENDSALMMPATGLFDSDGDGTLDSVFIVDEENRARLRHVTIGYLTTESAEITDSLTDGDIVIVETAKRLEDGVKVEIIETGLGS
ncbi:MAG: efflux RND transporter periplasmic adaptor subunit, partial [Candidatus Omnitrophota bacterium]